jgi:NAD(P)-dependent dehydrogenase (short-subunit alcohol dehydrogenase family)
VIITSIAALQAWATESVYCLTKAAQALLIQSMAIELAPFNILVSGSLRASSMFAGKVSVDTRW